MSGREVFAQEALAQIPKILTLQDRNPHSATYGCFDRNFWHYKIIDFPSGMAAEFVWPLALAYHLPIPQSPYYQKAALREWVGAGILYAAHSAHQDGSCDDYFPFEKAAGATAFALLAGLESYALLGFSHEGMRAHFARRADWLAAHEESGQLSNHQALTALCLSRAGAILGMSRWEDASRKRLKRVLSWQNAEGWFQEYEGADPGYHTLTIGLLAQLQQLAPSPDLGGAIERAIAFAAEFVHPDGSFGGEYGSRNTYNFFPHGFELAGSWLPAARAVNDGVLRGLEAGCGACYADDHILGHHAWSYLLAWQHFSSERPPALPRKNGRQYFRNAGLIVERRGGAELYLAINKGGVFKLFRDGALIASDTQVSLQIEEGGRPRAAVAHLVSRYEAHFDEATLRVQGNFSWAKTKQMKTVTLIGLRVFMLLAGRFHPDLVRQLLQKLLITGRKKAPAEFMRRLAWTGEGRLRVTDEVRVDEWTKVRSVGISGAQTSIYVVMSRTFQAGQLQPWVDYTEKAQALGKGEALTIEREF